VELIEKQASPVDWTFLRLLFDWRGRVSRREFRAGARVLWLMALTSLALAGVSMLDMQLMASAGVDTMATGVAVAGQYAQFLLPTKAKDE
jgi:uncharacterized membrane protein YhaH (DUF805 family)